MYIYMIRNIYINNHECGRYHCVIISDHNPQKWGLYPYNVLFHICKVNYSGLQFIFSYNKSDTDIILYCIQCPQLIYIGVHKSD